MLVAMALFQTGCVQRGAPVTASEPAPVGAPAPSPDTLLPPGPPPPEPVGEGCLTHARVESLLASVLHNAPNATMADLRLVTAACSKRVYVVGRSRFVAWDLGDRIRVKATSVAMALPTERCIERALALADQLMPTARPILQREAARYPALWRDPDVGAVSYLECDAADQPDLSRVATMLHETNHRAAEGQCIFDFSVQRDVCFELERGLPPGTIAAYGRPPSQLTADDVRAWAHIQKTYLEGNQHGLLELLDEVIAYRVEAELYAAGKLRKLFRPEKKFLNLPLIMTLVARYLNELGSRDPALAMRTLGPNSRNRALVLEVLDRAEASYRMWAGAVGTPGSFERTFWDEYQRHRRAWLARGA